MKFQPSRSLRHKLVGVSLLITLVSLLVALAAVIAYDLRVYHRSWTADMETQAELLGRMSAPALEFDDPQVASDNLALLELRQPVQAAALYTPRGELFARYQREGATDAFPELPGAEGASVEGTDLVLFRRIVGESGIVGTMYLRADYELMPRLLDYLAIAGGVLAVAMAIALLVSTPLQRIVTRPVLDMASLARDVVADQDYSRRATRQGDDEVALLAESLNAMLAEIQRRTEALQASNADLAREVAERDRAESEVLRLNAELERRVRERTEQLEAANDELETFCYSVSHDLRAPLRSINGFSQALVEDFPDAVPEGARRYLDRIRAASERMGQLIEDLLSLSNVSRSSLNRGDFDLADVAREVVRDLGQHDPARRVEVSIWDPMPVHADRRLVQAALENLVGNAWKFTGKCTQPRIEIGVLRDGSQEAFFVRDNGAGFDMQYADKLFSPFQRLHSGQDYAGTGIGLATVQRIVHRHGGRIWADARVGAGAAFFFTLPRGDDA